VRPALLCCVVLCLLFVLMSLTYISCVQVSCAADFVGVWKWRTGELAHRLHGHTMDVHRLQVSSVYIVTGSYDNTVCVWDYPSCVLRWTSPPVHGGGVSCLHFCEGLLVTGSAQGEWSARWCGCQIDRDRTT
jgi:WD40 repeat protein